MRDSMFSSNELPSERSNPRVFKEEEEACHPELVLIKEEDDLDESECEAAIKQEPLLWDDPEPAEDVKARGGAAAGSSGSGSASAGELSVFPQVLGGDGDSSVMARKKSRNKLTTSRYNRNKSLSCGSCEYRTGDRSNLNRHLRTHKSVRDKPFACSFCEYRTDVRCNLTAHLRMHEKVTYKPFTCNYCEHRTNNEDRLIAHHHIHLSAQDKPFACNHCQHQTNLKSNLTTHLPLPFALNHALTLHHQTDKEKSLAAHPCIHECQR